MSRTGGDEAVDLRPILPEVRDQGARGTCLAFAVTAAHEKSRSGADSAPEDLSEEGLYWGCKTTDGDWDSGTTFRSAEAALQRFGQPLGDAWPYDPYRADGPYDRPAADTEPWHRAALRRCEAEGTVIRGHLLAETPVAVGLELFDGFLDPGPGGHIADPAHNEGWLGRHAVVLVGYDADHLLLRNSWGLSWGDGGYGWITNSYLAAHCDEAWVIPRGTSG